jgi:hypothetical protein
MGLRRETLSCCRPCSPGALLVALVFSIVASSPSFALPLDSFECLTDNSAVDCAIGRSQLSGEIEEASPGEVTLTLSNSGPDAAVVARVYIESQLVAAINALPGEGVSFASGGSPPVLPGGNKAFEVAGFASALPPPPQAGIGPGETGRFTLMLYGGASFEDLVTDLRVGVHVIAFDSGGSESFLTQPIPEPSTGGLVGVALILILVGRGAAGRTFSRGD